VAVTTSDDWAGYEIRTDDDGTLDEVVASRPELVHLERMAETDWSLGINMPDGTRIAVNFGAVNRRAKTYAIAEVEDRD
jgi:cytochrome P450